MLSERSLAVLHAIVGDFVADGEPVGSQQVARRHEFGVSSATIRNDMAVLEEQGLITQPHTSSGRVPTDKGYRLYVDTLSRIRPLSRAQRQAIERFLGDTENLDDTLARSVRLLSQLTGQVALVQYPTMLRTQVQHIELVGVGEDRVLCVLILGSGVVEQRLVVLPAARVTDTWVHGLREKIASVAAGVDVETAVQQLSALISGVRSWASEEESELIIAVCEMVADMLRAKRSARIAVAGSANLSRPGEFAESLPSVLEAIEEQVTLLRLFSELQEDSREIAASIGRENDAYGIPGTSIIAATYEGSGDAVARLGVLGPMRMDYMGNIAAVRAVARYLHGRLEQ